MQIPGIYQTDRLRLNSSIAFVLDLAGGVLVKQNQLLVFVEPCEFHLGRYLHKGRDIFNYFDPCQRVFRSIGLMVVQIFVFMHKAQ